MPAEQAAGFLLFIAGSAVIAGLTAHYGVYDGGPHSPVLAEIVWMVAVAFIAVGGFLATAFAPRKPSDRQ